MPVQTSYEDEMQIAMPGMRSDSSLHNTDGGCAASGAVYPGMVVAQLSVANDKRVVKQVSAAGDAANIMGICQFSHYGCSDGFYPAGDAVNVMTLGRIWAVTADASAPAMNTPATVVTAGANAGKVSAAGGTAVPGWILTGRYTTYKRGDGTEVKLAEVQIRNQTAAPAAPAQAV
ncbi:hypothetical protein OLZ31_02400 [Enterobacter asburiae]|nr:hypothetical protein [Enterobacter asburiae]